MPARGQRVYRALARMREPMTSSMTSRVTLASMRKRRFAFRGCGPNARMTRALDPGRSTRMSEKMIIGLSPRFAVDRDPNSAHSVGWTTPAEVPSEGTSLGPGQGLLLRHRLSTLADRLMVTLAPASERLRIEAIRVDDRVVRVASAHPRAGLASRWIEASASPGQFLIVELQNEERVSVPVRGAIWVSDPCGSEPIADPFGYPPGLCGEHAAALHVSAMFNSLSALRFQGGERAGSCLREVPARSDWPRMETRLVAGFGWDPHGD